MKRQVAYTNVTAEDYVMADVVDERTPAPEEAEIPDETTEDTEEAPEATEAEIPADDTTFPETDDEKRQRGAA